MTGVGPSIPHVEVRKHQPQQLAETGLCREEHALPVDRSATGPKPTDHVNTPPGDSDTSFQYD